MQLYLEQQYRNLLVQKLHLELLHFLEMLVSDLQRIQSKAQFSSIQKELLLSPHSIKFTDTMETTEIQAHLVSLQFLVLVLQNQYKYLDTMGTTKIQAHLEHLHSQIHLSYIQKFVIFLRLVLVLQSFIRQVEQLSNPLPSPITRLKEDSKDLQVSKNPSVEQLTLVLVKLIPLELLRKNMQSLKNQEPMLLLSNSINNWRSITI